MTARRLLLASSVPPVPDGVGGVYLKDLCELYPPGRLSFAISEDTIGKPWPASLADAPRASIPRVPERGLNTLGRHVARATRRAYERTVVDRVHLPRAIEAVVELGRRERSEALWVPLAGPTMMRLAAPAARALGIPLLVTVWDPPEYALPLYWQLRGRALADVLDAFADAVRSSERAAVASEEMKRSYEARFGVPCVPMIHGLPESRWRTPSVSPGTGRFVIGCAGSLYAKDEWNALLAALGRAGWRIGGRDVVIRVLASRLELELPGPARIECLGWRSTDEAIALLSDADVCYIPYWFADEYRIAVQLSFPNKSSTYLAAGRPILFHGPRESSPARFLERHPVGLSCHSLDPAEILAVLERFASDQAMLERARDAIPGALREELGLHVFRRRFAEFVGVDEAELALSAR